MATLPAALKFAHVETEEHLAGRRLTCPWVGCRSQGEVPCPAIENPHSYGRAGRLGLLLNTAYLATKQYWLTGEREGCR